MKISEMTTEQARAALCAIIPDVNSIMADPSFTEKISEWKKFGSEHKGMSTMQMISAGAEGLNFFVPYILDKKAEEVYRILSVLNNIPVEEIKAQRILTTLKQIKEAVQDEELIQLFS